MDKENSRVQSKPLPFTPLPVKATRRAAPTPKTREDDTANNNSDKEDEGDEPQQEQEAPSVWRDALDSAPTFALDLDLEQGDEKEVVEKEPFSVLLQRAKETQRKGDLEAAVALWERARDAAQHEEAKDAADANAKKCARRLAKVERAEVFDLNHFLLPFAFFNAFLGWLLSRERDARFGSRSFWPRDSLPRGKQVQPALSPSSTDPPYIF